MSVFRSLRVRISCLAAVCLLAALSACGQSDEPFKGSDISGTSLGRSWTLTDHDGQVRTLKDYDGKVKVVFFGFTQCPDVCPTSLAQLASVMKALGKQADSVQVLMISVDPARDRADILKPYVTAFDPRFIGLRGTDEQTRQAAAAFKAYYAKVPTADGKGYGMDHTSAFYILDKQGDARVLAGNTIGTDALVHDIRILLK